MADAQLTPPSYLKYALKDQHNLVVLLGAACFSLAFASPIPVIVGGSVELLWLLVGPRLPAFRAWVDRQLRLQYLARAETAIEAALAELSADDANHFRTLDRNASLLLSSARERLSAREVQDSVQGLLELRRTLLDYLFLKQRVTTALDPTPIAEIEREAARLQQSYGSERDLTLRMTIRKALGGLQRRLGEQTALASLTKTIELRLQMLDAAIPYLRGRMTDPAFERLAAEIDSALAEIGPAATLELTLDQVFEPIAG